VALVRYNTDGSLDDDPVTGFGDGHSGYTITGGGEARAIAIDGSGKIIAAGPVNQGDGYKPTLLRYSEDGVLDTNFNDTGIVEVNIIGGGADALKIDGDGKYVIVGYSASDFMAARVNTNGTLDSTFNVSGFVTTDLGSSDEANAMAIGSNGKIVAAGHAGSGSKFYVVRYNADGTLDEDFGTPLCSELGGLVVDIAGSDRANAIAIDSDDKYIVAGIAHNIAHDTDFVLARFNTDGTLDTNFNATGDVPGAAILDIGGNDQANAVVVDGNKYVVAGTSHSETKHNFTLARYSADGTIDTGFGTSGVAIADFSGRSDFANALAVDQDGKYIVAGISHNGSDIDFALARFDSSGTLDTSFNTTGKVTTAFGGVNELKAIAVADGKYIVAGSTHGEAGIDFAVVRYTASGELDTSFNSTGIVITDFGFDGSDNHATSLAIQSDGKIVVAGYVMNLSGRSDFAVARYDADGGLDTSFGSGGLVAIDVGGGDDYATAVAITDDGIVISGYDESYVFEAVRLTTSGVIDDTFGTNGIIRLDVPGSLEHATSMAVNSCDGKITIAGYSNQAGLDDFALVRIK